MASEVIANRVFSVVVTGGEPLLVLEEISPFLQQLRDAGVLVLLNSNLTVLDDKMAVRLKELGIKYILTSLPSGVQQTNDEITQREGAHARTTRGIGVALANGIRITVNMVVTKANLGDIFATARYVARLGVKSFAATKAATPGNCPDFSPYVLSRDELRYMLRELVRARDELGLHIDSLEFYPSCAFGDEETRAIFGPRRCSAGKTVAAFGYDGQIRPCARSEATYGNIRDGLANAWKSMCDWRTDVWLPEQCSPCSFKDVCAGGCKVDALRTTGSIRQPDPMCDLSRLPLSEKKIEVKTTTARRFTANPTLRCRPETFGGILFTSSGKWVPVNGDLYGLFSGKEKEVVTTEEIASTLGVTDTSAAGTAAYLVSRSILLETGEKGEHTCQRESFLW